MLRLIFVSCLLPHLTVSFHHVAGINNRPLIAATMEGNTLKATSPFISRLPPKSFSYSQPRHSLLHSTTSVDSTSPSLSEGKFDATAVIKYGIAIAVQMTLVTLLFRTLDALVSYSKLQKVPFLVNFILFYGLALKSRLLNPMSNTRPQVKTLEAASVAAEAKDDDATTTTNSNKTSNVATIFQRKMPSWTPPGIVFPIVWLLIIGPIRAATTSMIYHRVGSYASLPILSLAGHLAIGDVWNTINNVERRFGVAVTGVAAVWLSKAHAAYQYRRVHPWAGTILGATLIWLTIASALVTATWRLNPDPDTGKPEALYPVVGKATTKFAWFSQKS